MAPLPAASAPPASSWSESSNHLRGSLACLGGKAPRRIIAAQGRGYTLDQPCKDQQRAGRRRHPGAASSLARQSVQCADRHAAACQQRQPLSQYKREQRRRPQCDIAGLCDIDQHPLRGCRDTGSKGQSRSEIEGGRAAKRSAAALARARMPKRTARLAERGDLCAVRLMSIQTAGCHARVEHDSARTVNQTG